MWSGADAAQVGDDLALLTLSGNVAVRHSCKSILAEAKTLAECLSLSENDRILCAPPLGLYGLPLLHALLMAGGSILFTERFIFEKAFWRFMEEKKATHFCGTSETFEKILLMRFLDMEFLCLLYRIY